jgi:peptidoglycan/xylan/chitin deacetylase (PgdA/CDA1 family)
MSARHLLLLVAVGCAAPIPALRLDGVATWRGDATAAYSITHDDVCADRVRGVFSHADPELTKRGLHAGFGAIVQQCVQRNQWNNLKTLLAHGHDVFSHSWSHPCLGSAGQCSGNGTPSSDYATQVDKATETLQAMLGIKVQYFIFPYDVCGAGGLARLKETGYLGARCGGDAHGVNDASFTDPFANKFDIWGPSYSVYGKGGPCAGAGGEEPTAAPAACRVYVLNHYVDEAIRLKGWANRELHGFSGDPGVWQQMPLADYQAHLDYVAEKQNAGQLWVAGPTPVIRYRFAREACAKPTLDGGVLKFGAPTPECQKYATTLSYLVSTSDGSDPASLSAHQGGVTLPSRKLGPGKFAVDADPSKGDATLAP